MAQPYSKETRDLLDRVQRAINESIELREESRHAIFKGLFVLGHDLGGGGVNIVELFPTHFDQGSEVPAQIRPTIINVTSKTGHYFCTEIS